MGLATRGSSRGSDPDLVVHIPYTENIVGDIFCNALISPVVNAAIQHGHSVPHFHMNIRRINAAILRQAVVDVILDALIRTAVVAGTVTGEASKFGIAVIGRAIVGGISAIIVVVAAK